MTTMVAANEISNVEYVLTMPNIVGRLAKNIVDTHGITKENVELADDMKPFVEALAKKFPQWRFVGHKFYRRESVWQAYTFLVYDKRERLGELSSEYSPRKSGKVYTIKNERISKDRVRGDRTKTQDLSKAVKIVSKMFGAKTTLERMNEVTSDSSTLIFQVFQDRRRTFDAAYNKLTRHIERYIVDNIDTIAPVALHGLPDDFASTFKDMFEERQIMEDIAQCNQQGNGAVVLIHGSDYVVKRKSATTGAHEIELMSSDTLPMYIKRSVGMLKLVEPKTAVAGVGVRVDDNAFFVAAQREE